MATCSKLIFNDLILWWLIIACTYQQPVFFMMAKDFHEPTHMFLIWGQVQWNLSITGTLNMGYLFNEDTVCSPNHIELCTNYLWIRYTSLNRTASWIPMVSFIVGMDCIRSFCEGSSSDPLSEQVVRNTKELIHRSQVCNLFTGTVYLSMF